MHGHSLWPCIWNRHSCCTVVCAYLDQIWHVASLDPLDGQDRSFADRLCNATNRFCKCHLQKNRAVPPWLYETANMQQADWFQTASDIYVTNDIRTVQWMSFVYQMPTAKRHALKPRSCLALCSISRCCSFSAFFLIFISATLRAISADSKHSSVANNTTDYTL